MTESTTISRRGAFQTALALRAAFAGVPTVHAAAAESGASPPDERSPHPGVYREFDEYGRILLEIGPRSASSKCSIYVS